MRVFSVLAAFVFFLCLGSHAAFAGTARATAQPTTAHYHKSVPSQLQTESQGLTLLEDLDSTQEEEFQSDNETKALTKTPLRNSSQGFILIFTRQEDSYKGSSFTDHHLFCFSGLYGNSCPIFLAHRVLRI